MLHVGCLVCVVAQCYFRHVKWGFLSDVSPSHQYAQGYVKAGCCHCSCPGWIWLQEVSLKESISCGCS